jgi:CubicO group peptidase (beta-lactamase class C family)
MNKINLWLIIAIAIIAGGCSTKNNNRAIGFWEGPHPADSTKKFYFHLIENHDSIDAKGYWTDNKFYNSSFEVDNVSITGDSISFFIPGWNCFYYGKIINRQTIQGGFSCPNEPFDSVNLAKNDGIGKYLIEAKSGCLSPGYQYQYSKPAETNQNIPTAYYSSAGDSAFIHGIIPEIISNKYGRINSFLVIKNDALICEEYFYGYTKDDLHQIESSTKSITSLLVGIAKDQGMIKNLEEPLFAIFPQYAHLAKGDYKNITISHLLSMTSGFSPEYEPYRDYDRIEFSLSRELINKPGSKFTYDGGNTEILGAIIKTKTGDFADAFAEKYLFAPLQINRYDWSVFRQNGYPCMGGSLAMLPRDMAKIGMLVLNNGVYNNQLVVSASWINQSTAIKTKTHIAGDDYGYHWWVIHPESNGKTYKTIWANGFGSQFIYIIPDLDVVIVTTGHNYENDSWAITQGIAQYLHLLDDASIP